MRGPPLTQESRTDPTTSPWPEPESSLQLIWCAGFSEVHDELPGLWRQVRHHAPDDGAGHAGCVDVVVDIDALGRLVAADVESVPLADLLLGLGDVEAAAAAAELAGLRAEVAVPALADLLERLLVAAATSTP